MRGRDDNSDAATHLGECAECTVRMNCIRALHQALTSHDSREAAGDPATGGTVHQS